MLSGVTTSHTPLWVADVHRASSLELLLTMSSDRQLVLTRHDLHQLLAKTDTSPDHTPRRRPFPIRARIRAHVLGTPALSRKQLEGPYRRGRLRVVRSERMRSRTDAPHPCG